MRTINRSLNTRLQTFFWKGLLEDRPEAGMFSTLKFKHHKVVGNDWWLLEVGVLYETVPNPKLRGGLGLRRLVYEFLDFDVAMSLFEDATCGDRANGEWHSRVRDSVEYNL